MRIDRLNIDGFGVFHDKEVKGFQQGINVLYGPNEAGKSTLLDFIRFTLFEYPHWKDDRRPPLAGGTHGGRLFLRDSADQSFSIYRKGDGKTVSFEQNGQETDNLSTYRRLIGNASIGLYKNVYAITLDELLNVDQLSKSGMEDRIFSMGMGLAGVDFGKFEKGLISHADEYYKARGSTQVLVNLVDQIREKETAIRELRGKLEEYDRLSAQKEELESSLSDIHQSREELSAAKNKYADYSRAYEPYVTYKTTAEQLTSLGEITSIPSKLKVDFEASEEQIKTTQSAIDKLEKSLEQLEESIKETDWNKKLAAHVHLLDFFKTNIKLYEEAQQSINQSKEKRKVLETTSAQILQKLGYDLNLEQLLALEGTFELRSAANDISEQKQQLERRLDTKTEQLNRSENEVRRLEDQLQSISKERERLNIKSDEERERSADRKIELDTQFQKALQGPANSNSSNIPLILAVIFVVLGGVLFALHTLSAIIVLSIAVLNLIFVLLSKQRGGNTGTSVNANDINKEIESIKMAIASYDDLKEKYNRSVQEFEQAKKENQHVQEEIKKLNLEIEELEDSWTEELSKKRLPKDIAANRIGDFLSNVEELKRLDNDAKETENSIQRNKNTIVQFEEKLRSILPDQDTVEPGELYELINSLESQQKAQLKRDQLKEQKEQQERELETLQSTLQQLQEANKQLLNQANVTSSGAFYEAIEIQEQWEELNAKKENAANTIKTICGADQLEETLKALDEFTPAELSTKKENTENDYDAVKQQYDELNRELASINTEIRHILEPDEMYGLQNEKESLQEQLKEQTKEWLSTKMALEVLNESKQRYEKERQPEVITQTRKYFKAITENAYEDLRISLSDRHVSIIDDRGRQKTVEELSRGTREQLLLALRLGLIEEYEKNAEPLPVALDDIMVNFDIHRAKNLAKVLSDFAKERQVILFTCHEHTRDLFKDEGAKIIDWRA